MALSFADYNKSFIQENRNFFNLSVKIIRIRAMENLCLQKEAFPPEKNLAVTLYGVDNLRLNSDMTTESKTQEVTFDDLLVIIGRKHDRNAFIRLFEYFAPRVKSFLMKGGLSEEIADELAQETMLTVWDKAGSYNPEKAAASTWIYTIARNKRVDALRKTSNAETQMHEALQIIDEHAELPDDTLHHKEQKNALSMAIADLPPEQAELIEKAFFEHKSHNDIAQETRLPLGTVKSRIRLALDRMRHKLGGQDR